MYPLDSPARHRREPSTRQRIRGAVVLLVLLAVVAGLGVFGGTFLSRHAELWAALPVDPRLLAWAGYAVPLAGLILLAAPTRSRVVRVLALLLLVPGLAGAVAMSRPRGMTTAEWEAMLGAPGLADAASATAWALLGVFVVWAVALVVMMASTAQFDDLIARARRSALVFGPLAITASLAAAIAF
ncbi:hypothetical protein [Allorhizocola rhizosphaerae]|uniref:hypothetical protein n=1 Tax=Allorhizocola rhizosphaerae TaxID=1872709 RepID=UPI000E3C1439|nr:hypothetical protein [Allorhizocola rhizosphaerae]